MVVPSSILFLGIAMVFWQESRRQETLADRLLSISFACWAALRIGISIAATSTGDPQNIALRCISAVPSAFVAMLMVMALYEEEKRRIERNMLALSNLNLATSSFVGGEIQRMLSQALGPRPQRGAPCLAECFFLHHGDPHGPTSVVAVGLNDEFSRKVQEEGLDDYLVGLVARLGGLLGFRDLRDDSLSALEKEPSIRRFREIAVAPGLRSVVGISLQAKENAFGVLLLGTPDSRRNSRPPSFACFSHSAIRSAWPLKTAYLIQQTSRRSEELHVLNEIGRALSSTLNKEDLLRKVWEELRRLVRCRKFLYRLRSIQQRRNDFRSGNDRRRAHAQAHPSFRQSPY